MQESLPIKSLFPGNIGRIAIGTPHSTKEISLNGKLAECLRQHGLDALEEQTLRSESGQLHQVDVLVNLDEYAVALEAEYAPQDGRADATKRLTDPPLEWRGVPVDVAYAIAYPASIKNLPPPLAYKELFHTDNLRFKHISRIDRRWSTPATGTVSELADVLHDFWAQSDNGQDIYHVAELASIAIDKATNFLNRSTPPPKNQRGATRQLPRHLFG